MFLLKILLSLLASYLIGSIPTAFIVGRVYKKIDIRRYGSGNIGATNAFRVLGKGPGSLVLIVDILKGILAATIIMDFLRLDQVSLRILTGMMAVVGHNWTVFLNFKGGKGIATSLGVLIGLTIKISAIRPVLVFTVLTWFVVFLFTGFVSLSSMIASIFLPVFMIIANLSLELISFGVVICIFVILRHRPNIKRLLTKEEPRITLFSKKR